MVFLSWAFGAWGRKAGAKVRGGGDSSHTRPEGAALRPGNSARVLKGSGEDVHGAVGAPLLDCQRRLIPKTRALSHYSGEPLISPANRFPVCGSPTPREAPRGVSRLRAEESRSFRNARGEGPVLLASGAIM